MEEHDKTQPNQKQIHKNPSWIKKIDEPGSWNLIGYDKSWDDYPEDLDFLSNKSGHHIVKEFEKEIYLKILEPFLNALKKGSIVLDAACGIGRFSIAMAKRGHWVHMVDACENNLKMSIKHLKENDSLEKAELYLSDISYLPMFNDRTFDATLAIEAVCYCSSAEQALKELTRVTKKGGLIVVAVEGKYGSIISDENVLLDEFDAAYSGNELRIKNHTFTKYYSKEELEKMVEKAGIKTLLSQGCIYTANGIFNKLIDKEKMNDSKYRDKLLEIEKSCQNDPVLNKLARIFIVVGVVK